MRRERSRPWPVNESLQASEQLLRKAFAHSNDAGFIFAPARDVILDVNIRACQMLGYTRDELLALSPAAVHPDEIPKLRAFTRSVVEEGVGWTDELACLTKRGERLTTEISASAVTVGGETLVVGWVRDISARKRAEAALRESEERFRLLVEHAADAFFIVEKDGRIVDVNRCACESMGYTREELHAMRVWDLGGGVSIETFLGRVEQMARGPVTFSRTMRRKDGTTFPVEVHARLFEARGRELVLSLARDVTERIRAEEERRKLEALKLETVYLQEEIEIEHNFGEIVGSSPAIRSVFHQVEQVAGTDSTVLITGETGTGKELVARAIHRGSKRSDRVLVKVNCAALSAGLIESELFGHERGAFTGALARRIGRFELANGGTIFLDEIGDLPGDLQAKLLRVLQEGEFERVGGTQTINVDVRVIAATNRDLEKAVEEGRFRPDLYYRLRVFPLHVPPLRDRPQDIPLLVTFFARKYAEKLGKRLAVPQDTLEALVSYSWPGNVRELANAIERAVILSRGNNLDLADRDLQRRAPAKVEHPVTLNDVQRQHITAVLQRSGWRVSGPNGAARILGVKPTTLRARMKKLGVERAS
jgi:formate hydrogenlyase transcriptional activator